MPAVQPLLLSFLLPSLFFLFLSTPVWSNSPSTIRNMMENSDMTLSDPYACYTPPNLENIFSQTCYKVIRNTAQCELAWKGFIKAFAYKDPETIKANDYNSYFDIMRVNTRPDTVLFWSGVQKVVEKVSENKLISSSANQISSLIFSTMKYESNVRCWCGNKSSIIDTSNPCPNTTRYAFWEQFSILLAKSARGITFWAGYGNRKGGAYNITSIFARFEFPNMTPDRVNRFVVIDMYKDIGEQCSQPGSLQTLRNLAVDKYGINGYACYQIQGDPTDTQQVDTLAKAALYIIRKEQNTEWYVLS